MQENNQNNQPDHDHYSKEHNYSILNILTCAFLIQEDGNNIAVVYVNQARQNLILVEPGWPGNIEVLKELFSKFLLELARLEKQTPGGSNPNQN